MLQSCRSDTAGSTRNARLAGIHADKSTTAINAATRSPSRLNVLTLRRIFLVSCPLMNPLESTDVERLAYRRTPA